MNCIQKQHKRRNRYRKILLHGSDILKSKNFEKSGNSIQHGKVSVRQHSIDVAKCSLAISEKLPFIFKEGDLIRGALLHDYFLYDWHDPKKRVKLNRVNDVKKLHGFTHAYTALNNAKKDFKLSQREEEIIKKHMWPLTAKPPLCREAWIVTLADKYCSTLETLRLRKNSVVYQKLLKMRVAKYKHPTHKREKFD